MKKYVFGVFLLLMTLMTSLSAEENPRAVIIFDASGSMWGQINGRSKIEIARDALKNVVREWNPSVELGLTVYGHRKKGACNDIESVIPVGKMDKNRVISTVMGIKPKGKTPISRSLRKVADELKYTEEKATIILISDGKETCDPDPCGTAKALEKEGIDFITHVIGFNVDNNTDKQLQCIAHATGGEYFSAKNATALNEAMKVIAKKVEVVKPKPKPKVKKLDHTLEVSASEKEGGKWIDASCRIYTEDKSDSWAVHPRKKESSSSHVLIPVGKYTLNCEYNAFNKKDIPVEIKAGEVTKVHVVFGQTGTVKVSASEKEGGKWVDAYNSIYKAEEGKAGELVGRAHSHKSKAGTNQLPIGKYILKSTYNDFVKVTPFEITAGEETKLHVIFGKFIIKAKCNDMHVKVNYEVYASSGQLVYEKKIGCSDTLKVTLDNGNYSVEAKVGDDTKEVKFTVGGDRSGLLLDMTDIKKESTKEELIKADNQGTSSAEEMIKETVMLKKEEQKSEKIKIGGKQIEIEGLSKDEAKQIEKLGAIFGALGSMAQHSNGKTDEKKQEYNTKADKEFDEMSQDLNMFTK